MLELKKITKVYPAGNGEVHALKGIDLKFRSHEFVSILGPSGCGKTTLLNIIGGLDQYTSGDLFINGTSTKRFKNRDWDTYRNHSIGFVFQSYNLIPHQTVLRNVELALTLSGVSKKERRERAKQALIDVGLGDQLSKRPNEMSGGQMQRVAIARALVNDPEIILADEPTGALDTETGVQIMEMLKKISEKRLIIMVTHNPELAEKYSSRIIRMLDGLIVDDSAPLSEEECRNERQKDADRQVENLNVKKKPSMSFWTAFGLSLKNLFTKKGRTTLTAFAGSIGIIGIALILAVSQGMTGYIAHVQETTLSSYPLTIEAESVNLTSLIQSFMNLGGEEHKHDNDAVYKDPAIYGIINALTNMETTENDLVSFKKYLEEELTKENSKFSQSVSGVSYTYDLDLQIYTKNIDGTILRSDTEKLMMDMLSEYMKMDFSSMSSMMGNSSMGALTSSSASSGLWQELLPGKDGSHVNDILKKQYDVVYGSWPNDYNEVVLVLDEKNELNDLSLYALGLLSKSEIDAIFDAYFKGEELTYTQQSWSYEEICGREYKTVLAADCYYKDEMTGVYVDRRETAGGMQYLYDNALSLEVVGIIRPNKETSAPMLSGSIAYTSELTEYVIEKAKDSLALKAQLENPTIDILTGLPFEENTGSLSDAEKKADFFEFVGTLSEQGKIGIYQRIVMLMPEDELEAKTEQTLSVLSKEEKIAMLKQASANMGVSEEDLAAYFEKMSDEELNTMASSIVAVKHQAEYAQSKMAWLSSLNAEQLAANTDKLFEDSTLVNGPSASVAVSDADWAEYYDGIMTFSDSNYENNLLLLGNVDIDSPASINLYTSSFELKDLMMEAIDDYNASLEDDAQKIEPTDFIGLMMSSVTQIIDAITYVLIAFVSISLIVSSIMIGVITLISVQERTKEIGILRAIGASKRDVSSMFNAETLIIGAASGLLGVLVTYLLCIPINLILHNLTGIAALKAFLDPLSAVILVLISMALTLVSGIIPSRSAAKKDPVVALRTE